MPFPLQPFLIARLVIDPPLVLAPMAGVTGKAFRKLVRELNPGCVGLYIAEFSSVEGIVRNNRGSLRLITPSDDDRKTRFGAQLFGIDPAHMAEAARVAQGLGADLIDVNAGCPAQKVVKKGGGSDLLKKPALIGDIVRAIKRAVTVPVTVKIRTGWDEKNVNGLEVSRIVQESGADAITVHGRTRAMGYSGVADWDIIAAIRRELKIPVIGNGDVYSPENAEMRYKTAGVHGLMIGRAILKNPWIFKDIVETARTGPGFTPSLEEQRKLFYRLAELLVEDGLPQRAILGQLKQMAVRFLRGKANRSHLRTEALRSIKTEDFHSAVGRYLED